MPPIEIKREEHGGEGRLVAVVEGQEAELTYTRDQREGRRQIVARHTGVPDSLAGRGVGKALVERLVDQARAEGAYIVPLCGFVKLMLERRKEWRDVRDPAFS
jgi:uncharacterized protein